MKITVLLVLCSCTIFAQTPPTLNYYGGFTTGVRATLAGPVLANALTASVRNGTCFSFGINVSCTSAFSADLLVTADNEIMQVCQVVAGPNATTVLSFGHASCPSIDGRGFGGSTAAAHFTTLSSVFTSYSYNAMITQITAALAGSSGGGGGGGGPGTPNTVITHTFTGNQTIAFDHGLNTRNPVVSCQDANSPYGGLNPITNPAGSPATVNTTFINATDITLACAFNNSGSGSILPAAAFNNIRYAALFTGSDCGAQINAAYADLPATGGKIVIGASCSFSTPIVFGVNSKAATLEGYPGDSVVLTYTGTTGTAITLDYGTDLSTGKGLRDITLTGPGHTSFTFGIVVGGSNGAQGTLIDNIKVQSFGTNIQFGAHTWITEIRHSMIRDGGFNLVYPSNLTESGENIRFDHVTFADAPSPHTNSVWIQGGGQEIIFRDCSFDQAQLRIGNGATSGAQVVISGSHFENPNFGTGVDYNFLVVDNNNANYVRFTDNYIIQDRSTGGSYARFLLLQGGVVHISGFGMYSPVNLTAFATLSNAVNVQLFGYNDLSGNTSALFGGSTTGFITSFPGTNVAATTGFNAIIGATDIAGVADISFGRDLAVGTSGSNKILTVNGTLNSNTGGINVGGGGTLRIGGTVLSDASRNLSINTCAGCAVSQVQTSGDSTSSTPIFSVTVNNKIVHGNNQLSSSTRTITLPFSYTSTATYNCNANSTDNTNAIKIVHTGVNQVTFSGAGASDHFDWRCEGN